MNNVNELNNFNI